MELDLIKGLLYLKGNEGVSLKDIGELLKIKEKEALTFINKLMEEDLSPFVIKKYGTLYKLAINEKYSSYYKDYFVGKEESLSKVNLEVMAIITFLGPVSVSDIDAIRGVSSRDSLNKLKRLELVDEISKEGERSSYYIINNKGLDYFDIEDENIINDFRNKLSEKNFIN